MNTILLPGVTLFFLLLTSSFQAYCQVGLPEELTVDDVVRTRDITKNLGKDTAMIFPKGVPPRARYRLKKKTFKPKTQVKSTNRYNLPKDVSSAEVWGQIGVTVWRLEPSSGGSDDTKGRALTQEQEGIPKRVSADTLFKLGDRVRLSIEASRAGYLYIFDREIYSDGTLGPPYQIFPTKRSRGGDNSVKAGSVVDIPSYLDPPFVLQSKNANWRGETLTIVIAQAPIASLPVLEGPGEIREDLFREIEELYTGDVGEYEQPNTAGMAVTQTETTMTATGTRQLTQSDPSPQTIYRVKTRPKQPMAITLKLMLR